MNIILKRFIKSFVILAGILLGVFVVLLFCMYFLNVNILGYQGVSGSLRGEKTEFENLNNMNAFSGIEVQTHSIPINIKYLDQAANPTVHPRVERINNLMGIVKRRVVPGFNSDLPSVDVHVSVGWELGILQVKVFEPKLVMAGWSNSCINIILTAPMMSGKNITIRTASSRVTVDNLPGGSIGSLTITGAKNDAVAGGYESASNVKLALNASAGSLVFNSRGGNITTGTTAFVTSAEVITQKASVIMGDAGALVISTKNSRVIANKVSNFRYFRYGQDLVSQDKASGGLINIEEITGDMFINSSAITMNVGTVSCNVNIGDFDFKPDGITIGDNALRAGYVSISINTFTGEKMNVYATSGRIYIKEMYKQSGATHQTQRVRIDAKGMSTDIGTRNGHTASSMNIKTTNGSVKINGGMYRGATLEFFAGEIKIETESGKVYLDNIVTAANVKTISGDINFRLRRPSTTAEQSRINNTFIITERGTISVFVQTNTRCFVNVIAKTRRMTLLDWGFNFAPNGMPTLLFAGDSLSANTPLLTFIANKGNVTISEAYPSEFDRA